MDFNARRIFPVLPAFDHCRFELAAEPDCHEEGVAFPCFHFYSVCVSSLLTCFQGFIDLTITLLYEERHSQFLSFFPFPPRRCHG